MHRNKGVALLLVLLIVAFVSIIATQMGSKLQLQASRAINIKDNNQAQWYAMGAEQYARKAIAQLVEEADGVIHLEQPWAAEDITFPLPGGGLEVRLRDLQSCFNINALQSEEKATPEPLADAFKRLLQARSLEIPSYEADVFGDSVMDWLDTDDRIRPFGAEDSDYEAKLPPYLPANNLMVSASELRMVHGAKREWLTSLLDWICVLPNDTTFKLNVNTLKEEQAPLLHALLGNGISLQDVSGILASRKPEGFEEVADFLTLPEITALQLTEAQRDWFDVSTDYFMLYSKASYNDASFSMRSILKVNDDNSVTVTYREFGGF
ncbi:type II secretion system minor pseudopilin GspK [Lacimicrobium alkaliphilum]|uniref:Type II secretion system protein K n=1 Tax=Lacimicrobium alkaliphilum TaxID=1526571 RepID=A0ABQ1RRV5_9ALTE|nr:type II secretion system minor pseudopilin GspK [Lacimicrobium alkaliphilum]GGD76975.1 type II secretion system protein K [Lacimicrobium alkaliphilum]